MRNWERWWRRRTGAGLVRHVACAVALVAILVGARVAAQESPDDVIGEIRVEGAERIEPATIYSYMTVRAGDPFDPEEIDESLKSLFRTGLFADVVLSREGTILVVSVIENPIINRIAFEGNRRIEDETLEAEVQSRPRVVYTRTRVQNDVARILEVYRRSGRFAASVEPKVIQLEQNRVDLVFEIDEGPLTGIRRISFIGNEAYSDSELRDEVLTAETGFFDFLTSDDNYDPDRLDFDRELLRRFYYREGYADFRVISTVAELTPNREEFFITFTLDEGDRYRFGTVEIVTTLPNLDVEDLRSEVTTEEGDWYNADEVDESITLLTNAVGDLQYAFVDVRPQVTRDRDELTVNVTYEVNEGPRVFVERIDIIGNVRTVDRVIRREIELVEGDPFNSSRLRRSEARIRNLGFFGDVEVNAVPGSAPDRTVIEVEVSERSTGELSIGAGFSTNDGPIGDISLRERNLLGQGQELVISGTLSGSSSQINLSFTEPYLFERDLSGGFDVFRVTNDNQDESSFDETSLGFALRAGYPLADRLRQTVRYLLERREVENVSPFASRFIRDQEGVTVRSLVGHTITYDQLDSRIQPTDGYILTFGNEFAGIGGDVTYLSTTLGGSIYFPLLDEVVLSLGAEAGHIFGIGEDVGINDRFFVGGDNLRGFETAGIGPRDGNSDALGGNTFAVGTVEVEFPLGLPEEFGITGRGFSDFGVLTDVDEESVAGGSPADQIFESNSLRVSVGAGVSWESPFGPVRLDFGFPVLKEDFDETETFRFSFGTRF